MQADNTDDKMTILSLPRRAGFAALPILAMTCVLASAGDFARCNGTGRTSHSYERGYRDLGSGYVSYVDHYMVAEPNLIASGETRFIEACASGKAIEVPVLFCVDQNGGSCNGDMSYDFSAEVDAALDKAMGSEMTTFDALAARLKKVSPETTVESSSADGYESCACHVAYPRLRGGKQSFSFSKN